MIEAFTIHPLNSNDPFYCFTYNMQEGMVDRLTSMAVFVRAAELGSFAAAARDLALSPQMVAKHVAALETRLGTSLLDRTTRRQSLTAIGRDYFERCKAVLGEIEQAEAAAQDMTAMPKGRIRVNAPLTFGTYSMGPFVAEFLSRFPDVEVDLILSDRFVDPLEEGFEVVLRIGTLDDSSMIARKLRPYRLIACAAPAYIARHGTPASLEELATHDWLVYGDGAAGPRCRWVFEGASGPVEVQGQSRMRSNNWSALLQAAIDGHGITLGPEEVLQQEIAAGRLQQILPGLQGPTRPMHVLIPSGRRATAKIRCFVDALVEAFGT